MNLYTIFLIFNLVMSVFSKNIVVRTGLEAPIPWAVGLKFLTEISNVSEEDCAVEVYPDECCLDSNDSKCDIIELMGETNEVIAGGATKTLTMVAPLLDPYERRGYCILYIDSRPLSRPKDIERDTVKIKLDTKLKKETLPQNVQLCEHIDEDPMNDCKPVNCDTYYNGKKSHFNEKKQRCEEVPVCLSAKTRVTKAAYNPISNKCVDAPAVCKDDIDYIKELTQTEKERIEHDLKLIRMMADANTTCTTPTDCNLENVKDELNKCKEKTTQKIVKINQKTKKKKPKGWAKVKAKAKKIHKHAKAKLKAKKKKRLRKKKIKRIMKYLKNNKYTLMILSCVVAIQCCLICTMLYCMSKTCVCGKKKRVIKKFFNYRQDASVTTPLIGTSNIDTETTGSYMSESSNYIDKKIKCYKACQKERKNMKLSMSDDILSKCITRRDWLRLPRSETIPEVKTDEEIKIKDRKESHTEQKKITEMKVNFQEEFPDKNNKIKSIVKIDDVSKSFEEVESASSEKEICCHSYNYDTNSNINTGTFKDNSLCKTFDVYNQEKKNADSIERSAQVYFSNDSLDEFLSERGELFINDIASKYSYSSLSSVAKSTVSNHSSKMAEKNIVKNVITLLSKKTKRPSSDPGVQKPKTDHDLALLHLSKASVFSSNQANGGKNMKRIKDSTSSI